MAGKAKYLMVISNLWLPIMGLRENQIQTLAESKKAKLSYRALSYPQI